MVFLIFIQISIEHTARLQANSGDPDQKNAVSDLGLHYLPMSYKKDPRLIWVN